MKVILLALLLLAPLPLVLPSASACHPPSHDEGGPAYVDVDHGCSSPPRACARVLFVGTCASLLPSSLLPLSPLSSSLLP